MDVLHGDSGALRFMRPLLAVAILVVGPMSPSLGAQAPVPETDVPQRPYRGVFGGNPANNSGLRHSLDTTLSFGVGEDRTTETAGFDIGFADPATSVGGQYSVAGAALAYAWRGRRVSFGASGSSRTRHYPDLGKLLAVGHAGGLGFDATLGSQTRIQAQQRISYTPLFALNPFPALAAPDLGQIVPPSPDLALARRDALTYVSTVGFSRILNPRSSIGVGYGFNADQFSSDIQDLQFHTMAARWDHQMTRSESTTASYVFRDGAYQLDGEAAPIKMHELGLDVERLWVHSRWRRTTVQLTLGATLTDAAGAQLVSPIGGLQFVTLLGQSWTLRTDYRRGVNLIAGLSGVMHADTFGATAEGLLTERIDLALQAGVSQGKVGLGAADGRLQTYNGTARVGLAVNRVLTVFSELFYYRYDDATSSGGSTGIRGSMGRLGLRVGVDWWAPIIRRRQP